MGFDHLSIISITNYIVHKFVLQMALKVYIYIHISYNKHFTISYMYTSAHFDSYLIISPHFLQMSFGGEESKSPFIGIPRHIPKIFWATSHVTESRQFLWKMPWSMDMTQLFHIISRLSSKKHGSSMKINEDHHLEKIGILVGGIPTPPKNDGVRQLGWWNSQLNGKS